MPSKKVPFLYVNGDKLDEVNMSIICIKFAQGYVSVELFNHKTKRIENRTFSFDEIELKMEDR